MMRFLRTSLLLAMFVIMCVVQDTEEKFSDNSLSAIDEDSTSLLSNSYEYFPEYSNINKEERQAREKRFFSSRSRKKTWTTKTVVVSFTNKRNSSVETRCGHTDASSRYPISVIHPQKTKTYKYQSRRHLRPFYCTVSSNGKQMSIKAVSSGYSGRRVYSLVINDEGVFLGGTKKGSWNKR